MILGLLAAFCLSGCFEAPAPVRENSQVEKSLWQRYVIRTDKAIQSRNAAIKTISEGRNEEMFQRNLAKANVKFSDANGKGDVEQVKQWTLAAVEMKQKVSSNIDSYIAEMDGKIAEDQALVKAAMGLHDKNQEWLDAGADKTAIDNLFKFGTDVLVPALKPSDVK